MTSLTEFVSNAIEKLFFRSAIVAESKALAGHFREVTLTGEGLKSVSWIPGQKVQFHLGNLVARTYTPMAWDAAAGMARFLFFLHGNGPGAEWTARLKPGDACQLLGPRDSLGFTGIKTPALFFGDETSIAAAQALRSTQGNEETRFFLEVSSLVESEEVLRCLDLPDAGSFKNCRTAPI